MQKKINICVVTATRAEYGLLRPVIKGMMKNDAFDVHVAVTGMHLSPEFGLTYKEIEADGVPIDRKIEILLSADTPSAVSKSMALAVAGFADYFADSSFDMLLLLGDRYETLAVAIAAMNAGIPIAHMHGGEITEGAVDDAIRHAITKLSYLHFTSTEEYRRRVIQLGEDPARVFNVGATGVENIQNVEKLSRDELASDLDFDLSEPYAVVTFHPVTLEDATAEQQVGELLKAMDSFPCFNYIVTKANADKDGRVINACFENYAAEHDNVKIFASLGVKRYLSALNYADLVIGNSSSGIIEVPSFHIPTVNIGDRQRGRTRADSVIDCNAECKDIVRAINTARSSEMQNNIKHIKNPYGGGTASSTSAAIIQTIQDFVQHDRINLKKSFFNIDVGDV